MRFDWDPRKAASNLAKHGISFEDAITIFDDPFGLAADDEKHSKSEPKYWRIGRSDRTGVIVVVFTTRDDGETVRVISARRASREERKTYEELN